MKKSNSFVSLVVRRREIVIDRAQISAHVLGGVIRRRPWYKQTHISTRSLTHLKTISMFSGITSVCLASECATCNSTRQPALLVLACQYFSTNCRAIGLRQNRCRWRLRSKLSGAPHIFRSTYPVFVHQVGSYHPPHHCIRLLALLYWLRI
jgi:hypothetical protein